MGERTSYEPGIFCWTDAATTDLAGAKAFYGSLFGWEFRDTAAEGVVTYSIAHRGGLDVSGLYPRSAEHGPPAWISYVSVTDANEVTDRARSLGATVVEEPFDVMDLGRVALLVDPTGAGFCVWQAGRHIGARLVNDPGAMCMNQLNTSDSEAAQRFYSQLFGWRFEPVGTDVQPYWGIYNDDRLNGGMMPLPADAGATSHWIDYFTSADLDHSVGRITKLGGTVLVPPMAIPSGRIAVALDPQGATFALFEGNVDP